jgi:NAD(P)H-hydrate epimerase
LEGNIKIMKIFTSFQVREIDAYTISNEPVASLDLMERAASHVFHWLTAHYDQSHPIVIFAGPGNNGGDALAVARMLGENYYPTDVFLTAMPEKLSPDAAANLERLKQSERAWIHFPGNARDLPVVCPEAVILDGLFGSGLTRPVDGFMAEVIHYINELPNDIIAIDIPSGLYGEDNTGNDRDSIIRATTTLTFEFPFLSFFFPENEQFVGEWIVLPIGLHEEAKAGTETDYYYPDRSYISGLLKKRGKFSHKGTFGHSLLIAGSYGMGGAAVLAARACLRAGAGLITVHVPRLVYQVIQTAVPEAMADIDQSETAFTSVPELMSYSAVGVGPGLGTAKETKEALHKLIAVVKVPLVLDADALNILSENKNWISELPEGTIITPHPGEFDRLAGKTSSGYQRNLLQMDFSRKYKIIVVLKGACTSVTFSDGKCYFNTTGNPGIATAGSGDVLTGIILSLLAQGYTPEQAALLGVYLHGLAGDIALQDSSVDAIIASDITDNLGAAFRNLRKTGL